jgi:hypothetical protein
VGLGGQAPEWDEYEWFPGSGPGPALAGEPGVPGARGAAGQPLAEELRQWLELDPGWIERTGVRLLLVDLDNLRAGRLRWQGRIAAMVWLAGYFDHVVFAGQHEAVRRARSHLGEYARTAHPVEHGSDLADHVLLDAASALDREVDHVVVVSNDGIFAQLAERWPVTVLSPDFNALSDRLRDSAHRVVDLAGLERAAARARRRARAT